MAQESIKILNTDLDYSKTSYYAYTKTKPSPLMDNIIKDTILNLKIMKFKRQMKKLHQYVVTQKISGI